jgi:hypothetical protein
LANKNLFMVVVAILLTSGVSLAAWRFHLPQKVAAVFAEPDAPAKKSVPVTPGARPLTTKPFERCGNYDKCSHSTD